MNVISTIEHLIPNSIRRWFFSKNSIALSVLTCLFLLCVNNAMACHSTVIENVVTVNNGNGTYTYTIDLHVEIGSFDGYGYGFALLFQNSTPIQPTVLNSPGFTPQVTRPGYDPLVGYTGVNIGTGPVPFFGQRYGNSANVLTYETTDDWWGFGSTPYDATVTVTVSGCIESISLDGDFRSMGSAGGDLACMDVYSTGMTCCEGGPLSGNVDEMICPGETFVYSGTIYDENNTSGMHFINNSQGCDSTVVITITIDPNCCNPQTSVIVGPSPLCQNASGNVYSVDFTAGSTYAWSVPAGAVIASGQGTNSITVNFGLNGGQISVVETEPCGVAPQQTFNAVLNVLQNLSVTNPIAVCAPTTVNLAAASVTSGSSGGGALTYWTNPTATSSLLNPNAVGTSGTYYIQAGSGPCSDIESVTVTVETHQTVAIIGPASLCQNAIGNIYSVANTPGSIYTWSVPIGAAITSGQGSNSITVDFGANGGQVSVIETLPCGDGSQVNYNVTLDLNQSLTITDPADVCFPNTVDLTAVSVTVGSTGGGGLTYWTDAAGTSALPDPNSIAASGTYYIQAGLGDCSDIAPVNATINNCASCNMTGLTFSMTDCYTSGQGTLQYDLEGTLTYVDAPISGTLIITDCSGNAQTFNPPFNGTQVFTVMGLPQNGLNCDFTAVFSDDQSCTMTAEFATPPAITAFEANCVSGAGEVTGTIEFNNPPATGSIVFEISDGTNTQLTNILPPFNSPESWTVSGLDPSAANYVITYYFSDFASCSQTNSIICGCSAVGGTTNAFIIGDGTTNFVLCDGDQLEISSNNDFTFPADQGIFDDPNGIQYPYQPGYAYMVYTCAPTPGIFPLNDQCFLGFAGSDLTLMDVNNPTSIFTQYPAGTFSNNQVFYVPTTLYHFDPVAPAYVFNANCWALGTVTTATYLPPIVTSETAACQAGTVSVLISGGYPEVLGGDFMASNLLPATASFVNTTAGNNGSIVIEGLQNGDNYSFDIEDGNGCYTTISGGPFVGVPAAEAGPDNQSCVLEFVLEAVSSSASGIWTGGPVGTMFLPNANNPNALVSVPNSGTFTFTWTEDNGNGCSSTDDVVITFSSMSIPAVVTNASCGLYNGEVTVAPQGGTGPYSYNWTSGGNGVTESNLGAGSVTVTVSDNTGCSLDSIFAVTQPTTFNVTVNASDANCFGVCDGVIEMLPDGSGPYTYNWTPNVSTGNTNSSLCPGAYEILVSDQDGCSQVLNATIAEPIKIDALVSSDKSEICIGGSANLMSIVTGGTQPFSYDWSSSPQDPTLDIGNPAPWVSPSGTTTYTLVVTDANGCQSAPKNITIEVLPELILIGSETSLCPNEDGVIDLSLSGGDGNYAIFLLPDQVNPVTLPMTVQPSETSSYDFMVTDGCETPAGLATSTVIVHGLPEIILDAEPKMGCAPLTVNFTNQIQPSPQFWNWSFGDSASGSNSAQVESPNHTYEDDGLYNVSLSITTTESCSVDTVIENYIEVYPVPVADFDMSDDLVSVVEGHVKFTDQSEGDITNWFWDLGDGSESIVQNPNHRYEETGSYEVLLEVVSVYGCSSEAYQYLEVEPGFTFYVPNAFTPNNDRHNNKFQGVGEGVDPSSFQMSITNRWGEMIYHTGHVSEGWDGTFKGLQVEVGAYVYEISLQDLMGKEHYFRGHVSVVR